MSMDIKIRNKIIRKELVYMGTLPKSEHPWVIYEYKGEATFYANEDHPIMAINSDNKLIPLELKGKNAK